MTIRKFLHTFLSALTVTCAVSGSEPQAQPDADEQAAVKACMNFHGDMCAKALNELTQKRKLTLARFYEQRCPTLEAAESERICVASFHWIRKTGETVYADDNGASIRAVSAEAAQAIEAQAQRAADDYRRNCVNYQQGTEINLQRHNRCLRLVNMIVYAYNLSQGGSFTKKTASPSFKDGFVFAAPPQIKPKSCYGGWFSTTPVYKPGGAPGLEEINSHLACLHMDNPGYAKKFFEQNCKNGAEKTDLICARAATYMPPRP